MAFFLISTFLTGFVLIKKYCIEERMLRCLLNETPLEIKLRHEFRRSLFREHNFNKWIKGSKKMEQSKEGDR